MKTSENIELISAALVAMQAESQHANFDSKNPHFKSKYASLAEVIDTAKPVLAKHGLAIVQLPAYRQDLGPVLCTRVIHTSGQFFEEDMILNPVKNDPQGIGSALTYMRRYSIPGVCMIASEDDDDGNAASYKPNVTSVQAKAISMEEAKKNIASFKTVDDVRHYFPFAIARLGAMKGSQEYIELTELCTNRVSELKASQEQAAA